MTTVRADVDAVADLGGRFRQLAGGAAHHQRVLPTRQWTSCSEPSVSTISTSQGTPCVLQHMLGTHAHDDLAAADLGRHLQAARSPAAGRRRSVPCRRRPRSSIRFIGGEPMKPHEGGGGFSNTSIGVPICSGTPWYMTIMRCASVMASTWSWVTYRLVVPRRRCSFMISGASPRAAASRFDSGSSNRKTRFAHDGAAPTRWRWPPDSAGGGPAGGRVRGSARRRRRAS